jgi:hypothetical protein
MRLEGSCHCGKVKFSLNSTTPQPYMRCWCSICRKTAGGGGFAINIMGEYETLEVTGRRHLGVYRVLNDGEPSDAHRHFCKRCGSALWVWSPNWPELVHPFASAIDTALPRPREWVDIMLNDKVGWAPDFKGRNIQRFDEYPAEAIAGWHAKRGLAVE